MGLLRTACRPAQSAAVREESRPQRVTGYPGTFQTRESLGIQCSYECVLGTSRHVLYGVLGRQ
eukprot:1439888-Rhodomonas_salina.1